MYILFSRDYLGTDFLFIVNRKAEEPIKLKIPRWPGGNSSNTAVHLSALLVSLDTGYRYFLPPYSGKFHKGIQNM